MVLRKEIVVNMDRQAVNGRDGPAVVAKAIAKALAPNYQDVEVDSSEVRISGRQFEYVYETPEWLNGILDGIEAGTLHSVSFTLKGERSKRRL